MKVNLKPARVDLHVVAHRNDQFVLSDANQTIRLCRTLMEPNIVPYLRQLAIMFCRYTNRTSATWPPQTAQLVRTHRTTFRLSAAQHPSVEGSRDIDLL
jgi:hypothetical protein